MICPQCNYHGGDGVKWCPKCGTLMQEEASVGPNSLEEAMKLQAEGIERRKMHAYAEEGKVERLKTALEITGSVLLCLSLLHFGGIIWSFLYELTTGSESNYLIHSLKEASGGHMGRVIVYNVGDFFETNSILTLTEILMGIMLVIAAFMCFTVNRYSLRKMYYKTMPLTLFVTYFCYTVALVLSNMGMGDGGRSWGCTYKELFGGIYILYIFVAAIVTLVAFFNYKRKHEEWQYYVITESKGSASRPSANYVPILSTLSAKPAAQKTTTQNVAQTVKPTADRNTLKCSACGEGGQPLNRNCCWKCGAKFIK